MQAPNKRKRSPEGIIPLWHIADQILPKKTKVRTPPGIKFSSRDKIWKKEWRSLNNKQRHELIQSITKRQFELNQRLENKRYQELAREELRELQSKLEAYKQEQKRLQDLEYEIQVRQPMAEWQQYREALNRNYDLQKKQQLERQRLEAEQWNFNREQDKLEDDMALKEQAIEIIKGLIGLIDKRLEEEKRERAQATKQKSGDSDKKIASLKKEIASLEKEKEKLEYEQTSLQNIILSEKKKNSNSNSKEQTSFFEMSKKVFEKLFSNTQPKTSFEKKGTSAVCNNLHTVMKLTSLRYEDENDPRNNIPIDSELLVIGQQTGNNTIYYCFEAADLVTKDWSSPEVQSNPEKFIVKKNMWAQKEWTPEQRSQIVDFLKRIPRPGSVKSIDPNDAAVSNKGTVPPVAPVRQVPPQAPQVAFTGVTGTGNGATYRIVPAENRNQRARVEHELARRNQGGTATGVRGTQFQLRQPRESDQRHIQYWTNVRQQAIQQINNPQQRN